MVMVKDYMPKISHIKNHFKEFEIFYWLNMPPTIGENTFDRDLVGKWNKVVF